MNYKVGDEVLVKAKMVSNGVFRCELMTTDGIIFVKNDCVIPAPSMTAEEAWEIAKRICTSDYDGCENALSRYALDEIFEIVDCGKIMNRYTPQQAKAKIEAWEEKIEIGDFVEFEDKIFCVTRILGDYYCGIDKNGSVYSTKKKCLKKTGRHINIEELMKKVGDTE